MIKMPSGNRNIYFLEFQLYARAYVRIWTLRPEFRELLKITANYLWQSVPGHKCANLVPN